MLRVRLAPSYLERESQGAKPNDSTHRTILPGRRSGHAPPSWFTFIIRKDLSHKREKKTAYQ